MQNEENASPALPADTPESPAPRSSFIFHRSVFEIWTLTQRRSILLLSVVLLIFLAVEALRKPAAVGDPVPYAAPRAEEIQDRLDPNVADAAALAAIPELGEKKAAEIVEYREKFARKYPDQHAFTSADDLLRLKGFGLATVANLRPYLVFPVEKAAATLPSGLHQNK